MELWQFSLFFVALLLGYVMLHVRVARFETYLHELQRLASLDSRLQAIGASMPAIDKQRLDRIESLLQRLHEYLGGQPISVILTDRSGLVLGEGAIKRRRKVLGLHARKRRRAERRGPGLEEGIAGGRHELSV